MSTATRPMTAEEFFDFVHLPENADRWFELDEGEVVELSPPPRSRHGIVCANIACILGNFVRNREIGFLYTNDTGLVVSRDPDTVRGPDLALFSDDREFDDLDVQPGYEEETPTLVVEVLSPGNRPGEIRRKVHQYLHGGVKLVWVVDPAAKEVIVHQPGREPVVLSTNDTVEGGEALPEFTSPVIDFFRIHKGR